MSKELLNSASPISIESIYAAIRDNGFSAQTTQLIDNYTNDILHGKTNLTQFNQAEYAGLCYADAHWGVHCQLLPYETPIGTQKQYKKCVNH